MKTLPYLFFAIGLIISSHFIVEKIQNPALFERTLFQEIQKEPITKLVLKTDLERLLSNAKNDEYEKGVLTFINEDTANISYNIKVKPRGVTRKQICDFPPLKLKFSKEDLAANELAAYNSLKLVGHCQEGEAFEQVLLKEYTVYKMYNALTEKSFKVQLVEITYMDSNAEVPASTHYGFLIENKKEMANRLNAKLRDKKETSLTQIDADQYRLFSLFQYMIGNTDWNLSKQHNLKLLIDQEKSSPIPIPYDFDFAGLVNSPSAKPYHSLPIKDVRERFFQYRGKRSVDFSKTYNLFKDKKEELMDLHEESNLLEEATKTEMTNYLATFFDLIEEPLVANKELALGINSHG